ncbi:MAG TPA: Ig-like domain-containing protein, partial [Verrucomicrobiae bacterium]|nr:Ig-like domain-containing protein [Verrucomicrobiae bacterium]
GSYSITAVATASGILATSTPVSFSVTASAPPTVSLTNPANAAVFAAPANLKLGASTAPGAGPVTNVQFFANTTTLLGSATVAPFTAVSSSITAGSYSLTAVATAAGISATSAPVNVSVVTPVSTHISSPNVSAGLFSFSYNANPGLSYVVEGSSNLINWLPLVTNVPSVSPVPFSNPDANHAQFYRIDLLPNP